MSEPASTNAKPIEGEESRLRDAIDRTEAVLDRHRDEADLPEFVDADTLEAVDDTFPPEE